MWSYPVLIPVSRSYPRAEGRFLTCYSPVRRSSTPKGLSARLACVKHAASVRPEPGSNSPLNAQRERPSQKNKRDSPNYKFRRGSPGTGEGNRPADRVVLNALAFSTLLSSQETDAHHPSHTRSRSGATSLTYQAEALTSTQFRGTLPTLGSCLTIRILHPRGPRAQRRPSRLPILVAPSGVSGAFRVPAFRPAR
jgi:hypothetical protein